MNNNNWLKDIVEYPHRLGYLIGKTKLTEIHSYWIKYIWYPKEYFYENNNAQKMVDYFNSLGKCYEISNENNQIQRTHLTKKIFLNLIDNPKRSLQAHRGSYKTSAIITVGCIIRLLFDPNIRMCLVQKDFTKAALLLKSVKDGMLIPQIQELFRMVYGHIPKATTARDNLVTYDIKKTITPEGNVNAFGIHQNMIGKHFDFIVADDFVTLDDKISKAERDKTKIRLEDIMGNVLDPGKQMGLSGTPWHKNDAWSNCPPPIKFDLHMLDILSEEMKKQKRKDFTPVSFAANYELRHVSSDETLFKDPQYDRWLFFISDGIGSLDKAYSGDDTNALAFAAKKPNGRYQVFGKIWKGHIKNHYDDIHLLWKKYKIGKLYCENNDDKDESTADRLMDRGIRKVESYHESLNKHVKIQDYVYENGFFDLIDFDPDTDPEFINQVLDYAGQGSDHDDCPEVLANLGRVLIGKKSDNKYTSMFKVMSQNS